ncbi:MAG: hypothetical protein EG822_10420 [Deltaproteobacteria bacterium]|nr:hypothetical protein [Deltaproteobacteria bacterium]TLN04077.1 MAG: hypothetical protein FDZ73_05060 [bacterium]
MKICIEELSIFGHKRRIMKLKTMTVFLAAAALLCSLSSCTGDTSQSASVGTWQDATFLMDNARLPVIGSDGNGNTIAVWWQSDGLYSALFDQGQGWKTPQKIVGSESLAVSLSDVHLAVNAKGDAIVAWVHTDLGEFIQTVQTARYTVSSGWSTPQQLTPPNNMVFNLDIALDASSNAVIAWEGLNPTSRRNIVVSYSMSASGWDSPHTFGADNRFAQYPKIAVDSAGNAFVLWLEGESYPNNVYVNRYSPDTGWSSPQQIATNVGPAAWTNISFDNSGNAMAVWGQSDSSDYPRIYSCRYVAGSGWGSSEAVDSNTLDSIEPALTVDSSGSFRSVWVQFNGTGNDIYGSRYAAGSGWGAPQLIGTGGNARSPRVATDGLGNAFAVWQQYDPSDVNPGDAKVYANRFTAGSGWGSQRQLKNASGGADAPELAVDSLGHATVIWSQSVGYITPGEIKYGIFADRFQ